MDSNLNKLTNTEKFIDFFKFNGKIIVIFVMFIILYIFDNNFAYYYDNVIYAQNNKRVYNLKKIHMGGLIVEILLQGLLLSLLISGFYYYLKYLLEDDIKILSYYIPVILALILYSQKILLVKLDLLSSYVIRYD